MKVTILSVALVSTLAAIATPAQAQSFDGPYVGVTAGWNRSEQSDRTIASQPVDARASRDGLVLGGYAGYNRKLDERFVIGVEAGFSGAVDDQVRARSAGNALTVDPRYSFDLTARAGYLVSDKALVYVRGGYANTRVRTTLETPGGGVRRSDDLDGWVAGGGIEYAVTERISARAEYRYSDFQTDGGRFDRHQTLIGVSYNF